MFLTHVLEIFSVDQMIQGVFFNTDTKSWIVDENNLLYKRIFYTFPKLIIVAYSVAALFYISYQYFTQKNMPRTFIFVGSIILVPLILSSLKEVTFMYCPSQLDLYGGEKSFRALFDFSTHIPWTERGKCYPAGHASGGFALMSFYFVFQKKSLRIFGLFLGLILGWVMALYQMLKGAHFLSHSVTSMLLSWAIILYINYMYEKYLSATQ